MIIIQSERNLNVFQSFHRFFYILTIFNMENFRHQNRWLALQNICIAILKSMLLLSIFLVIFGSVFHCIIYKFDFSKTALPIGLVFGITQMTIAFISMAVKYKNIKHVVVGLDEKINRRNEIT